jgi:hypothetical protein
MEMKIKLLNEYVKENINELEKSFIFDNNKFVIIRTDYKHPYNIRIYPYYKNNKYEDLVYLAPYCNYYMDKKKEYTKIMD